jgi:hypothetical protein
MTETRTRDFHARRRQLIAARRLQRVCVGARDAASQRETPPVSRPRNYREYCHGVPWRSRCITPCVPETTTAIPERRGAPRGDRRKNSRSGRRTGDPHTNWRRLAWLFAAYATYLSIRSLTATMKRSVPDTVKRAVPDNVKDGVRKIFGRRPTTPA